MTGKALEMELVRLLELVWKIKQTLSFTRMDDDDYAASRPDAGPRALYRTPPGPSRKRPPAPARSRGLGPAPIALQCTGALVVSLVVELWDASGMQKRFGTGSRAENKTEIRRNQLEIRRN
jgi:hypothetical protein